MKSISERIKNRLNEAIDDKPTKGMSVYVYRHKVYGDTSNKGLSSKHNELTLVDGRKGKELKGNREIDREDDYLVLLENGSGLIAVPSKLVSNGRRQFGGNFIFSSDSRFPSDQPIKVHDRVE